MALAVAGCKTDVIGSDIMMTKKYNECSFYAISCPFGIVHVDYAKENDGVTIRGEHNILDGLMVYAKNGRLTIAPKYTLNLKPQCSPALECAVGLAGKNIVEFSGKALYLLDNVKSENFHLKINNGAHVKANFVCKNTLQLSCDNAIIKKMQVQASKLMLDAYQSKIIKAQGSVTSQYITLTGGNVCNLASLKGVKESDVRVHNTRNNFTNFVKLFLDEANRSQVNIQGSLNTIQMHGSVEIQHAEIIGNSHYNTQYLESNDTKICIQKGGKASLGMTKQLLVGSATEDSLITVCTSPDTVIKVTCDDSSKVVQQ